MKTTSRILQYFVMIILKIFLAPITFAKNFGFLAGVVSQIFAIDNALKSRNQFLRDALEKSYRIIIIMSPYNNNRAQKLDSRNRIYTVIHVLANSVFLPRSTLYKFYFKGKQFQNLLCLFFSGKLKFPQASKHMIYITCLTGKFLKKLILTTAPEEK